MILQVHDELLFAFPTKNGRGNNLREVAELRWLMEMGGDDLGIVTPVSVELHTESWEKGTEIKSEKSKKSGTGGK